MKFFAFVAGVFAVMPVFASANVIINEIAWMGSPPKAGESSAMASNNEWIELYNNGSQTVDLSEWMLVAADGQPNITLVGSIKASGYFLLERTDDETVPGIAADLIYTGALSNSGEKLELKDANGLIIDTINAASGWPAGDNATKETMQKSGTGWITASPTPRAGNGISSNQESRLSAEVLTETGSANQEAGGNPALVREGPAMIYEQKRFFTVEAGEDIKTVAGAEARFSGAAFGFDSKPLDETSGSVRYLWNFGDGSFFEAKNTNHIYRYPGAYSAVLQVSSGQTSGSDVIEVIVGESSVVISEMAGAWIELANEGVAAVDLSSWQIRSDASVGTDSDIATYAIPARTMIGPRAFVVFSQETTSLPFGPLNPKAELRYANGTLADTLFFVGTLLPEKSIIRDGEGSVMMGEQTPGKENNKLQITNDKLAASLRATEKSEAITLNTKGIASSVAPPRNDEQALVTEAVTSPNLPLYKGRSGGVMDSNYFWLAVSISMGLIAGVVVLALRAMLLF